MDIQKKNLDPLTVAGFGDEWTRFNQDTLSKKEQKELFDCYFDLFPWQSLPEKAVGFDMGCGSGRWAQLVAPRVGELHLIDASAEAISVAKNKLAPHLNCIYHHVSVDEIPLSENSMDFGYSLGVLHHVPNTLEGLKSCTRLLKPGAPFLFYLYYKFDNRPIWFRAIWLVSNLVRKVVSLMPNQLRYLISQMLAILVYWPLARTARIMEKWGVNIKNFPLSAYRDRSFYTMRTDALDRFGTRLEKRFEKSEISKMMYDSGLENCKFSANMPFWVAVGNKRAL